METLNFAELGKAYGITLPVLIKGTYYDIVDFRYPVEDDMYYYSRCAVLSRGIDGYDSPKPILKELEVQYRVLSRGMRIKNAGGYTVERIHPDGTVEQLNPGVRFTSDPDSVLITEDAYREDHITSYFKVKDPASKGTTHLKFVNGKCVDRVCGTMKSCNAEWTLRMSIHFTPITEAEYAGKTLDMIAIAKKAMTYR